MENNQLKSDAEELKKQASGIQSEHMKTGQDTTKDSFAAAAQSVADKAVHDAHKDPLTQPSLQRTDVAPIMSAEAKSSGAVESGSFAATAQSMADRVSKEAQ